MEEENGQEDNAPRSKRHIVIWVVIGVIVILSGVALALVLRPQEETNTNIVLPNVSRVPEGQALKLSFLNHIVLEKGHYEAWVVLNDMMTSIGKFTILADGKMEDLDGEAISFNEFDAGKNITAATEVVVTIESDDDADPLPSPVEILRGNIDEKGHSGLLRFSAVDFNNVRGRYLLETPTDGANTNETSGIAFLTKAASSGSPETVGLTLPELPDGWIYEGWVTADTFDLSTGRFLNPIGEDSGHPYSAARASPKQFPGEDFLQNAPIDLNVDFPLDLADGKTQVRITIEPYVDGVDITGDGRFGQNVLLGYIPAGAQPGVNYDLSNDASDLLTATAIIN